MPAVPRAGITREKLLCFLQVLLFLCTQLWQGLCGRYLCPEPKISAAASRGIALLPLKSKGPPHWGQLNGKKNPALSKPYDCDTSP